MYFAGEPSSKEWFSIEIDKKHLPYGSQYFNNDIKKQFFEELKKILKCDTFVLDSVDYDNTLQISPIYKD